MRKILTSSVLILISLLGLRAQSIQVSGTVIEAKTGEPLVGVSVFVPGTTNGTITDIDGNYTISVPANATINISSVGYKELSLPVNGRIRIDAALEEDNMFLDESVVVGYSVQKKRDVLGSVSKVDGTELRKVPVSTVQQSLQGRIAGVEVASQTGAPGASISVRVRGTSSISSSNEPLYIVDGIPVEGALSNISPNDIESISILKDASSAAIYGSRATNGVVLISTKSGKSGDARITYNMQAGVQTHGRLTPMTSTSEFIELYNEAAKTDNAASVVKRPVLEGAYVKDFPNVNHLEEIFQVAPIQSHELSVSGGSEKTQYLISGSYYNQDGIIKNTNYRRASIRSNIGSEVKKWLKLGLNISASLSDNRLVSSSGDGYVSEGGSIVRYAFFRNPAIPVFKEDGTYVDLPSEYYGEPAYNTFFGDGYSPEGLSAFTDRTNRTKTFLGTGNALITIMKDMFIKSTFGIDYRDNVLRVFNPTWGTSGRINATNSLDINKNESFNWTFNATFNHSLRCGGHSVNYLIGTEAIRNHNLSYGMSDSQFADSDPGLLYIGLGEGVRNSVTGEAASSLLSFFTNVNYNYESKYYLSAILRRDGSSRFSAGNRWGTFYSLAAGWNIEQEDFLRNVSWLNKLKLRAGYGAIGNQNIGLYAYSDRYSSNYYYTFGGNSVNGFVQTTLGNKDLKWETSKQFNAGLDIETFKGSFGVSVDYYYKVTDDMLVQESLPISIGKTATPWVNNGSVLNTGADLEIFYRKNYRDWGFDISFNGGYLYNEVLSLKSPILGGRVDSGVYATKTEVGHPIGSFYVYEMDGIFQNESEILLSAVQGKGIKPGDVKYVDQDESGVIDSKDRKYMGSAMPKFTTGLNFAASYKRWDASLFFQGAFGQKIFSQINYDIEGFYRGFNVTKRYYNEHWKGEGTSNTQPRASWAAKSNNVRVSTRFLEDGSYLRLKNIQIGYNFKTPESWNINNLRAYIAASNLLTFTAYQGLDPEMTVSTNSASEGDRANGIDWGTYPVAKSFTFGLNLTF